MRRAAFAALGVAAAVAPGCGSSRPVPPYAPDSGRPAAASVPGSDEHARDDATASPDRVVALINGEPITWNAMQAPLLEAAGGSVLEDLVLDRQVRAEFERRGLSLTPGDLEHERELLTRAVTSATGGGQTDEALDRIRRVRGLGPARFDQALSRTAMLRRLVSEEAQVTDDQVRLAYEIQHGPRYACRLLVTATHEEAARLRERLMADGVVSTSEFADLAAAESIDESAARGGLIEPFSPADPAYPLVVRQSLAERAPGTLSDVLALERGYALVLVEHVLPRSGVPIEQAAASLREDVRLRQERLLMDRLARRLLESAAVRVLDPALNWSWRSRAPGP